MNRLIIAVLALALSAALFWGWQSNRAKEEADLQLGLDSSRILQEQFGAARQIKVATVEGNILARSTDPGFLGLLKSSQTKQVPFTVDYYIDLSSIDSSDFYWDEQSKTMTITAPDIVIGNPNIDESKAATKVSGVYISRKAGLNLNQKASNAVRVRAEEFAQSPENITKAREQARAAMQDFAKLPLAAVGKNEVTVVTKFPFDGAKSLDRWQVSRSIEDILRELKSREK